MEEEEPIEEEEPSEEEESSDEEEPMEDKYFSEPEEPELARNQ